LAVVTPSKIRHLTDVSACNLQQYLYCNYRHDPRVNSLTGSSPDWPRRVTCALPDRLKPARQGNQMDTMAPIRPTVQRPRCISLAAGPAAAAEARSQVRAAIYAWNVPVDPHVAVLLTSELVTNAIRHEAGETVMLVIFCAGGQLRVDVHDTSWFVPVPVDAPADAEAGRGLMLVASLSTDWGFYRTPTGKAVYFTLAFQAHLDEDDDRSPQGDRSYVRYS
jgi:anti-sigma regulatory factor (Ser/Thr protein kinase)